MPRSLRRIVSEATLAFPVLPRVVVREDGLVLARVEGAMHARSEYLRAVLPDGVGRIEQRATLKRRTRLLVDEPLGGLGSPFATLEGQGLVAIGVPDPRKPLIAQLDGEPFDAREEALIAFDGTVEHESGRLVLPKGATPGSCSCTGPGSSSVRPRPIDGIEITPDKPRNF